MLCKVRGCVWANTRPHQLHWSDWEMAWQMLGSEILGTGLERFHHSFNHAALIHCYYLSHHTHIHANITTQIILHLRSNPSLLDLHNQVTRVLRIIADQMMKEEREGYSLKLYYIAFILQQCHKMEGGTSGCLKMYNACTLNSWI